jgi:hypothetical protein
MYQICGGPAPSYSAKCAHPHGVNNVNFAHPKALYAPPTSIITLKQKLMLCARRRRPSLIGASALEGAPSFPRWHHALVV